VINISYPSDLRVLKCDEAQFNVFILVKFELHCSQYQWKLQWQDLPKGENINTFLLHNGT